MYEIIPVLKIKIWLAQPAVYFALALFFGLMSVPQPRGADLIDRFLQYFLSILAALFLYSALAWFPK
jgi:hypothetical protein